MSRTTKMEDATKENIARRKKETDTRKDEEKL